MHLRRGITHGLTYDPRAVVQRASSSRQSFNAKSIEELATRLLREGHNLAKKKKNMNGTQGIFLFILNIF
jgi:hypothetical protein